MNRVAFVAVAAVVLSTAVSATQAPRLRDGAAAAVLDRFDLSASRSTHASLAGGLREVSGLAADARGHIFAHADERGVVSRLHTCDGTVEKSFSLGFPPVRADFEGMAIVEGRFFLITSTGQLYETREGAHGTSVPFTVVETGFGRACEIEGLTWDAASRTLVTGCKEPRDRVPRGTVTFLRWSVDAKVPASPPSLVVSAGGASTRAFRTSAVEYDATSGNFVAVAGPERQLLEFTTAGEMVAMRPLDRQLHRQPEGLALVGDSLLVIADEGAGKRGTLTCYRRKR
jgi:uncharacterized protein YjiK